jgi:hypothetical protein
MAWMGGLERLVGAAAVPANDGPCAAASALRPNSDQHQTFIIQMNHVLMLAAQRRLLCMHIHTIARRHHTSNVMEKRDYAVSCTINSIKANLIPTGGRDGPQHATVQLLHRRRHPQIRKRHEQASHTGDDRMVSQDWI